jgi:signal transduction histidine kinase
VKKRNVVAISILMLSWGHASSAKAPSLANSSENLLEIQSVLVGGKSRKWQRGDEVKLGPSPEGVTFNFGPLTNSGWSPTRLRYKLEGFDDAWKEEAGAMCLTIRYSDEHGDQIGQVVFEAAGQSAGWNSALTNSTLSHRRETLVVPPSAFRVWATISSGCGPPALVGIYLVDDLVVTRLLAGNEQPEVLLHPTLGRDPNAVPADWMRDGIRPSMAKVVEFGTDPKLRALAIVDDDPAGHAEWHNRRETAPRVAPGDRLLLEWNELFSMGRGDTRSASYAKLPPGNFRFRVQELTALGVPTGIEDSLKIYVRAPLWEKAMFWPTVITVIIAGSVLTSRYVAWHRMRREVALLRHQRALEQERLRIAQDIHDDLGARVTQIALSSAMAHSNEALPEKARAEFNNISRMTRELISALYETVWAVNPENDNLDALGGYLCQIVNELCTQARLRCRLEVVDLPRNIQVSSQTRHNIIMVVKEGVHNVIKHASAAEVTLHVGFDGRLLTLTVQDDGCGFDPAEGSGGSGLSNLNRRLADIGGTCCIQSKPGKGTHVEMSLPITAEAKRGRAAAKL